MSGMMGKRAVTVTAATASLDNPNQEIYLTNARCDSQEQTVEAQRATLHTRPDGTLARVEAEGDVTMQANGATVVSERADVALNAKSQPQSALLTGGVRYSNEQPLRQMRGEAQEATIAFDTQAKPQPEDAVFNGAAHMTERTRATQAANEPWSTRDLTAAKVVARLARTGADTPQLRDVDATGSARLVVVGSGSVASTRGEGRTELAADELKAHLIDAKDARQPPRLDTVAGRGHTLLHQVTADGIDETSSGDLLDAKFRPGSSVNTSSSARLNAAKARPAGVAVGVPSRAGAVGAKSAEGVDDLLSAVQQGHITMIRRAPSKSGTKARSGLGGTGIAQEDFEQATADRAAYDGDLDRVTLTGGVEVSDRASALWAGQVALDRKTGDVQALGAVKVNYLQDNSAQAGGLRGTAPGSASQQAAQAEPTHVLAERAELVHATSVATFYGRPVRMWQGGSQVQAPEIKLERAEQRMTARGEGGRFCCCAGAYGVGERGRRSGRPGNFRQAEGWRGEGWNEQGGSRGAIAGSGAHCQRRVGLLGGPAAGGVHGRGPGGDGGWNDSRARGYGLFATGGDGSGCRDERCGCASGGGCSSFACGECGAHGRGRAGRD
jgi:lipopolysaccharide export system protein LptA